MIEFSRRQVVKGLFAASASCSFLAMAPAALAGAAPEKVEITAGERTVRGVLAVPDRTPAPALVVIHEWWGLNDQMVSVAERLAAEGYLALAVDLYGGEATTDPAKAKELMMAVDAAAATATMEAWIDWLRAHPKSNRKVGTLGFCFGGGWSLNASLARPVDATVIYYGYVTQKADALSKLEGPVLGHFATRDARINRPMVDAWEAEMRKAGKRHTTHWYEAEHAFANERGARYDEVAAKLSWQRTLAFLKETL